MHRLGCLSLVVLFGACGGGGPTDVPPDDPPDGFDRSALLSHLSNKVFLPAHEHASTTIASLPGAVEAHCAALESSQGVDTTLDAVHVAFASSVDAWQLTEGVLVGPAAADMNTLRGLIYGWPNVSPCEIDKDTATRWNDPNSYNISAELVSTRSLAAVEYLLYPPSLSHNCVGAPAGWDAMGSNVPLARCRLAQAIATDVAAQAAALANQWKASYASELADAGNGSSIATAQAGVNLVSDGMFYVDKMVKDMKVGEASGIAMNSCGTIQEPCLREVELRYSDRSTFAIRANLAALRQTFTGDVDGVAGTGFDDYLTAVGHGELGTRMLASLDNSIAMANALPDSYLSALSNDRDSVVALHTALRAFTDDLKSQFLTVLALEIPDDVAADND